MAAAAAAAAAMQVSGWSAVRPVGLLLGASPPPSAGGRSRRTRVARRARRATTAMAAVESGGGVRERPVWSGESPVSWLLNQAIRIEPTYRALIAVGRALFLNTARSSGVPWDENRRQLEQHVATLQRLADEVKDPRTAAPEYYLSRFHGYYEGNLCWDAALEVESASQVMGARCFPDSPSPESALLTLRDAIVDVMLAYRQRVGQNNNSIRHVLDAGCSCGLSTRHLAQRLPNAHVTGLDLSPNFLAVARFRDTPEGGADTSKPRNWEYVHACAEDTRLPDASQDVVACNFIVHELPQHATRALLKEAMRVLRPGGTLYAVDNDPRSKTIQSLPPFVFTAMKASEPFADEYYTLDLEEAMRDAGFKHVEAAPTDHRHRSVLGTKL